MKLWRVPLDQEKITVPNGTVHIIESQCKGCGFCVEFCPKEVLQLSDDYNAKGYHPPVVIKEGQCVDCKLCEIICPEFSIFVTQDDNGAQMTDKSLTLLEEADTVEN
jgi:2-oxoglutarate ferredoxin oxidoreductase subunit delta